MLLLAADLFGSASFSRSPCKCFLLAKSPIFTNYSQDYTHDYFHYLTCLSLAVSLLDLPVEVLRGTNERTCFPGNA